MAAISKAAAINALDKFKADGNNSKKDIVKAENSIQNLKDLGMLTSGKGGGRSGKDQTTAMSNFVKAFDTLVDEHTKKEGFFLDAKGTKRIPRQYMPKPKPKK